MTELDWVLYENIKLKNTIKELEEENEELLKENVKLNDKIDSILFICKER